MTSKKQITPPDRSEEIINWTLPGLTMYYRDSQLEQSVIAKYEVKKIFRAQTFTDVSSFAGKPTKNCRFIFASSKAAPMYKINPDTQKWGFHTINANSYFKVLDVYKYQDITQIFLIHIPFKGIDFFSRTILRLGDQNIEEQIIRKSRESLHKKMSAEISIALEEKAWIDRTAFPIGLDIKNEFFLLEPKEPMFSMAKPLFTSIRKMTNDLTDLNEVPNPAEEVNHTNQQSEKIQTKSGQEPKKKRGFWSSLFK